ncbi:MAG: PASTA domain-containing protein [Bacteroidota bacterium]
MRIKVGIFFGGPSREREISFAGGRTVYDNLDKSLFEAVPIFVDSYKNWYLLNWEYLYKGSIRDFFPPIDELPSSPNGFQVYQESLGVLSEVDFELSAKRIGRRIRKYELNEQIDIAFLALHGIYGEDGTLQAELEQLGMPYTGSSVRASQIGMDKALQKELMAELGFPTPPIEVIRRADLANLDLQLVYERISSTIGWPLVIRPAHQGSSIGVSIIEESAGLAGFEEAINRAFFREQLPLSEWKDSSEYDQIEYVRFLSDIRDGLGYPLDVTRQDHRLTIYHPEDLLTYLNDRSAEDPNGIILLEAHQSEENVILEGFIKGKEFSTIVLRTEDGEAVALPPTEIIKGSEVFDYRSKYLPGLSRKVTPIDLPEERIEAIRRETERLFKELGFTTYARIDGFHGDNGQIYLNDPNTTSGMLPSSFFFHQAAEIGLNPSQFLTCILRTSLAERKKEGNQFAGELMTQLDTAINNLQAAQREKKRIAVVLGGSRFERHISVESGRNIYEKLASSDQYLPLPVFLTQAEANHEARADFKVAESDFHHRASNDYDLYQLPINLLLKDNADDIRDKIRHFVNHPILVKIRQECQAFTKKYAARDIVFSPQLTSWDQLTRTIDGVFIALHGRPGEDGQVQMQLEARNLPYNGSGVASSSLTINKYRTLQKLREAGFAVADQLLARKADFLADENAFYDLIEGRFNYPLIAKPVDDGCSSAVKLIRHRDELHAYARLMFRVPALDEVTARRELKLKAKEEFPTKEEILFEELITAQGAVKFLEITGGMLMAIDSEGHSYFEVFEPSETLAGGEILSLEEKFLAGEGQNLTPARLYTDRHDYATVATQVKADLEKVAKLLDVQGYCRIDAFVRIFDDGRAETIVIEVNSLPGMTPATAIFHQAAIAGYQPYQFIDRLLEYGFKREAQRHTPVPAVVSAASMAADEVVDDTRREAAILAEAPEVNAYDAYTTPNETIDMHVPLPPTGLNEDPFWKRWLIGTKNFVFHQYFWRNVGVLAVGLVLGFFLLRTGLHIYTNHGEGIVLPDFTGMMEEDARRAARQKGLRLKIDKGKFIPNQPAGLVYHQHPTEGNLVKSSRRVYLKVLSDEAPSIKLPSLVGKYDYHAYTRWLAYNQINYRITEQVYDPKQEEETILHFYFDDRKITDDDLRRGVEVPVGATLDFVVTVRQTGEVRVPDLVCQRYGEATFEVSATNLAVGQVNLEGPNRNSAFVTKTEPAAGQMVKVGTTIDIYLSQDQPDGCE